jgi:hydrogenase-4 membrane subunit HyfE
MVPETFYDAHAAVVSSCVAYTVFTHANSKERSTQLDHKLLLNVFFSVLQSSQVLVFNFCRIECRTNLSHTRVMDYIFGNTFFSYFFYF